MKAFKSFLLAIVILGLSISQSYAQKAFKVVDATSMRWSGGMPQSGYGTNYCIEILLLGSKPVSFDDVWVGDHYVRSQTRLIPPRKDHQPTKGDTVMLTFSINTIPPRGPVDEAVKPLTRSVPIKYNGAALLSYTIGHCTQYKSISKFRTLPAANYP